MTNIVPPRHDPRRCGAFTAHLWLYRSGAGSSPQVRGIFATNVAQLGIHGIIPAGAGHLDSPRKARRQHWDHPRRCGAFIAKAFSTEPIPGSSPQVRGISSTKISFRASTGIIPAGAGHFSRVCRRCRLYRDHPRRCGAFTARHPKTPCLPDHPRRCGAFYFSFIYLVGSEGSSPQVRGI